MICYRCRQEAGKDDYCPSCGTDLRVFQKAVRISNTYYNDGLEKARVRNLSGSIISLKKSLKLNKYNTDARNLLGLVYYEMGETVDALSEWVISKNFQPEDNRAGAYLNSIQKSQGQLAAVNQTIKKYNQALVYCRQGSRDLAIIQLRKVLSLNSHLVKGHQLMALLYIQENKLEQAKKSLRSAGKIDTNNTLTLRYLKEVNQQLKEQSSKRKKRKPEDDLISYQSGNETIIMPKRFKESSLGEAFGYIVLGLAVGVAVTCFLIVPNVRKLAVDDARKQLLSANDTITTNTQTISSLNKQIEDLQAQLDDAAKDSEEVQEEINAYEDLLNAYVAYAGDDMVTAGEKMEKIDKSYLSKNAKEIYRAMEEDVTEEYLRELYAQAYRAYNRRDYEEAIEAFKTVVEKEEDYEDGNAAYYLAQSYRANDDLESAQPYYKYIIENHPNTSRAATAKNYVDSE